MAKISLQTPKYKIGINMVSGTDIRECLNSVTHLVKSSVEKNLSGHTESNWTVPFSKKTLITMNFGVSMKNFGKYNEKTW